MRNGVNIFHSLFFIFQIHVKHKVELDETKRNEMKNENQI